MKYFKKGRVDCGHGEIGIILTDSVLSISKSDGNIVFREECDGYFAAEYPKEKAIELLEEAISWIKDN